MSPWLLCDYGEVLCRPQPETTVERLAELAGLARADLLTRYWAHREPYDRGDLDGPAYWSLVLAAPVAGSGPGAGRGGGERAASALVAELIEVDTAGWLHPDHETLAAVARARDRGWRTAILSNAPREIAAAIDASAWLADFSPRLFSCDLGTVKPDRSIYRRAVLALGACAADVTFFDDRRANVDAANEAGLRAHHFSHPGQIDQI